jgi:hypothetical protein
MRGKPIQKSRIQEVKNSRMMRCETRREIVGSSRLLGFLTSWLLGISRLTGLFAVLMSLLPAFADPSPVGSNVSASGASPAIAFVTVNHLGEAEPQAALRDGQLLSHRRATDPFGIAIRGPFKGLPPVVEHPTATPEQPNNAASQVAAPVNLPTLEKAVQELAIGAVNVDSHQILIGSRSIREGDLLVLESGGRQFVVWVQTVGVAGVWFCDTDLQKHIMRPFGSGPKELPGDSVWGISDIENSLSKDAQH